MSLNQFRKLYHTIFYAQLICYHIVFRECAAIDLLINVTKEIAKLKR